MAQREKLGEKLGVLGHLIIQGKSQIYCHRYFSGAGSLPRLKL
jgi:hypothetical protein